MRSFELEYTKLVNQVVQFGERKQTRAGPTRQMFGTNLKIHELPRGEFPLLTARKMFPGPVLGELAAFLRGATDLATYKAFGCNYWDANAAAWVGNLGLPPEKHRVGQVYGAQWRNWKREGYDQLLELIRSISCDPHSRRHLLTAYDPAEKQACLPPCHLLAQFNVTSLGALDCCVYMRSVDLCLGLPSDVVLYAALLILVANETGYMPGVLTFMLGDTHIYENHVDLWIGKQASADVFVPPRYTLSPTTVFDFTPEKLELSNYHHGERIDYQFNV